MSRSDGLEPRWRWIARLLWVHVRWLWSEVQYAAVSLGYVIRPYDMLADRRRWWWQPRQRCGFSMFYKRK